MSSDHNSLLYWYPEIREYFPTPMTATLSPPDLYQWMEDGIPDEWFQKITNLLQGKYPVFFRTDSASNKHEWKESCVIHNEKEIRNKIFRTLDFNYAVDLWPQHLVFRELLKPYGGTAMKNEGGFEAFGGFPVSRELRFFMNKGTVECVHRYWLHEVFVKDRWAARTVPKDWERRWKKLYAIPSGQIRELSGRIENDFSPALKEENWSVDFMYASKPKNPDYFAWYLIDMALAEQSFHADHSSDLITPQGKSMVESDEILEKHSAIQPENLEVEKLINAFKGKAE